MQSAQGKNSFYFDIKLVDETNTKAKKAQYIAEVFEAFGKLLGEIHAESYGEILQYDKCGHSTRSRPTLAFDLLSEFTGTNPIAFAPQHFAVIPKN